MLYKFNANYDFSCLLLHHPIPANIIIAKSTNKIKDDTVSIISALTYFISENIDTRNITSKQ